jgi:hypothetical protein
MTDEEMRDSLEAELRRFSGILKSFPKGPMNLTPDPVKATPEWKAAKAATDKAFANLRAFNSRKNRK